MRIELPCCRQIPARAEFVAFPKRQESFGVMPIGGVIVLINPQQFLHRVMIAHAQEPSREQVANALIIIRIKQQHDLQVINGGDSLTAFPQAIGERCAGSHVRARFQYSPEVTHILIEGLRTQCLFSGGQGAFVMFAPFKQCPGLVFCQNGMRVGAQIRNL